MKKRIIALLLAVSMIIPTFSGCMSREEKQEAAQNVAKAGPVVEQYLADFYPGARLNGMKTLIRTSMGLFVAYYATELVHADVILPDGGSMEVICDLRDNVCYDTSNAAALEDAIRSRLLSTVQNLGSPKQIDVRYYSDRLRESWVDASRLYGFVPRDITTVQELLTDGFIVNADIKYDNSGVDLSICNPVDFFGEAESELKFTDYVNGRFDSKAGNFYCANETLSYSCELDSDSGKPDCSYVYCKYDRTVVNGVEYAWNSNRIDVSFSEEAAPETVVTEYYSGRPFHSADGKLTRLVINHVYTGAENDDESAYIFTFFDRSRDNQKVLANIDGDYDCWTIEWRETDHLYRYFYIPRFSGSAEATLGFYILDENAAPATQAADNA